MAPLNYLLTTEILVRGDSLQKADHKIVESLDTRNQNALIRAVGVVNFRSYGDTRDTRNTKLVNKIDQ